MPEGRGFTARLDKKDASTVKLLLDELALLHVGGKVTGCQARVKFSPTYFADADERQAVVFVRYPNHTVGQALGSSVKPISGITLLR